jgi:hypothetical protein
MEPMTAVGGPMVFEVPSGDDEGSWITCADVFYSLTQQGAQVAVFAADVFVETVLSEAGYSHNDLRDEMVDLLTVVVTYVTSRPPPHWQLTARTTFTLHYGDAELRSEYDAETNSLTPPSEESWPHESQS